MKLYIKKEFHILIYKVIMITKYKLFEQDELDDPFGEDRDTNHLPGYKAIVLTQHHSFDKMIVHIIPIETYNEIIEKFDSLRKMQFAIDRNDSESKRLYNVIMDSPTLDADEFYLY